MTAARGVALGAHFAVAVVVVAVVLLGRRPAQVQAASSRTPASSSRATRCRSAGARRHGQGHRADRQQPGGDQDRGRRRLRAAARGHDGDDPRDVAVGRRQPLHRARRPARTTAQARRRRRRSGPTTRRRGRPRPALQHARPEDPQGAAAGHPGLGRRSTRARASNVNQAAKYFNPALSTTAALVSELDRDQQALHRLHRQLVQGGHRDRRARATTSPSSSRNANTTAEAIGDGERRARARARAAARHAAPGQHDVREPARDARRPRHAVDASKPATKHLAPFFARAAPAGARRAADDRGPAAC